jgi:hypothetical protein
MEKYEEKFHADHPRKLSSWEQAAKRQILRYQNDDDFRHYISTEVMKLDENPPGPFTRFLYWFALSCQAGWGVMVDFNEYRQRIHLVDKYYKWMHKLRDELDEANGKVEEVNNG